MSQSQIESKATRHIHGSRTGSKYYMKTVTSSMTAVKKICYELCTSIECIAEVVNITQTWSPLSKSYLFTNHDLKVGESFSPSLDT